MRHLPPLNALRVFEVAARTGSYTEAASELGLTHGAVSRQIALLESWLGQRLFSRSGRRMVATPIARSFASEVSGAFERMTAAAEACGIPDARRILRVNAPVSFAMRWLIPRLNLFHAAYPSVDVVVTTVSTVHEDLRGGFDVAIRRGVAGAGSWPHHRATHVLDDVDTLIMSPSLFAQRPLLDPADLEGHKLLAAETRPGEWIDWLEAAKLPHLIGRPRTLFDHFFITRQAVMDGIGVGIGPLPMLDIDIAMGHIVTPFPHIRVQRTGYVALLPKSTEDTALSTRFVEWLAREGAAGQHQLSEEQAS